MNIAFRDSFIKDLEKIQSGEMRSKVRKIIDAVEAAQNLQNVANVKKLKNAEGYYRIRLGDYRIGLSLAGDTVIFVRCLHRKDIYRYFP